MIIVGNRKNEPMFLRVFFSLLIPVALFGVQGKLYAGGGPENLILVVNQNSPSSLAVANLYIELRKIPSRNVIYLDRIPNRENISLADFRELILKPVLSQLEKRKLGRQIHYIVYSADFPTAIGVTDEMNAVRKQIPQKEMRKLVNSLVSINAMTFYASAVVKKDTGFFRLDGNWYHRGPLDGLLELPAFFGEEQSEYQSAMNDIDAEKFDEALKKIAVMLKRNPLQYALHLMRIRCYAALEDGDNAALALVDARRVGWKNREFILGLPDVNKLADHGSFNKVIKTIPADAPAYLPSMSFQQNRIWAPNGGLNRAQNQGQRYVLSTVLAVTRNRGTTLDEALAQIRKSVAADYSRPAGTFVFTLTGDIRTKTRQPNFAAAIQGLQQLGLKTEIVEKAMPRDTQICGATTGTAKYDWPKYNNTVQPGAIIENLTSFGGRLYNHNSQTSMMKFIQAGAAGTSGTVCEPYALQQKFPNPMIHVHYARGCNLAESFYQSVQGPFQLLIVGDALCQPWASPPKFTVNGLKPNQTVTGNFRISTDIEKERSIAGFHYFLDGMYFKKAASDQSIRFDSEQIPDGYHEMRVVALSNSAIETQSSQIIPFVVDNLKHKVRISSARPTASSKGEIVVQVDASEGKEIKIYQNSRVVGVVRSRSGSQSIKASKLGIGTSNLHAAVSIDGKVIQSVPIKVSVTQ